MDKFTEIDPRSLAENPFQMIGEQWMLITAAAGDRTNAMTASWGGLGVLWGRPVAYIFIRPQRFTKTLVDASERLSLCFLPEEQRENLRYFGAASGRDEDKIAKSGLTVEHQGDVPYFAESETVLICRKLYRQTLDPAGFIDGTIDAASYPARDYHDVYVCEIEQVLKAE